MVSRIVLLLILSCCVEQYGISQEGYFQPLVIRNNQDYTRIILNCYDTNVAEIHMVVTVDHEFSLILTDDGLNGDATANDGKYTSDSILINVDFSLFQVYGITPISVSGNDILYIYNDSSKVKGYMNMRMTFGIIDPAVIAIPDISRSVVDVNIDNTDYVVAILNQGLNIERNIQLYYKYFEDNRDFLILARNINESVAGFSSTVSNSVSGIGMDLYDHSNYYGSHGGLQSIIQIFPIGSLGLLNHEILHRWAVFLNDSLYFGIGHWGAVEGNSSGFGVAWGIFSDISYIGDNYYKCTYLPQTDTCNYFNDLELYLMGLKPANELNKPFKSLKDPNFAYYGWGTAIFSSIGGISTKTIQDIINSQGKRNPEFPNTQKKFHAGMIVMFDRPLTDVEFAYFNYLMQQYEQTGLKTLFKSFADATRGLGEMKTRIISMNFKPELLPSVDDSIFLWETEENAVNYRFQLSRDDSFDSLVLDTLTSDTKLVFNTSGIVDPYCWRVKAINDEGESYWSSTKPNTPPTVPECIYPVQQSTGINKNVSLSWMTSDADGDTLKYEVLFGNQRDSLKVLAENSTDKNYSVQNLSYNTTYFWQVKVTDRYTSRYGPVWDFKTKKNSSPSIPILIYPENNTQDCDPDVTLAWTCSDPDSDNLVYYLYLGNDSLNLINKVETNDTTYNLNGLNYDSVYYWRVSVTDGDTTVFSGLWKFKTKDQISDINDDKDTGKVLIFPNPASRSVFINFKEQAQHGIFIEIMDLAGKIMCTNQPDFDQSRIEINVSRFPRGIYLLNVYSDKFCSHFKILIE